MEIIIDFYTKNKSGKPNFEIHHLILTDNDIEKLAKRKIKENPPRALQEPGRIIDSISIEKVIV